MIAEFHHVLRLEVAVHDTPGVQRGHGPHNGPTKSTNILSGSFLVFCMYPVISIPLFVSGNRNKGEAPEVTV